MLASDIIDEVKEATGKCDTDFNLRALTRAVQLLAGKGLIDPLVGYFDFSVSDDYFVALPRVVKTVLRVNINKQPTFSRARLYEFHVNSLGTTDGEDPGLNWADRGYSPIQDEKQLPGKLRYKTSLTADNGRTCTVHGLDANGREVSEVLTGHASNPTEGAIEFHKVLRVQREETAREAFLWCNGDNVCAQYYADETQPSYRVIKLSRKAATVRVMFRRQVFAVRTVDDFIPMDSAMAVIEACKAVRFFIADEYPKAQAALEQATAFLREEQATREEHNTLAENQDIAPAIDSAIFCRDSVIVADVYDTAADVFGAIGKRRIFDKITGAIEALSNRGQWDARLGIVDVFTADNTGAVNYQTPVGQAGSGLGYYVLPRHVETPVAISYRCGQSIPRNRWFEFHMNGSGGLSDFSDCGSWDRCGEVCLIKPLPLDGAQEAKDRGVVPTYFVAVPDNSNDDGAVVRMYGFERDANGRDIEVWRAGERGWVCPCVAGSYDPGDDAPRWVRVDRITKAESAGFIRLYATAPVTTDTTTAEESGVIAYGTSSGSELQLAYVTPAGYVLPVPTTGDTVVNIDGDSSAEITHVHPNGENAIAIWTEAMSTFGADQPVGIRYKYSFTDVGTLYGFDGFTLYFNAAPNVAPGDTIRIQGWTALQYSDGTANAFLDLVVLAVNGTAVTCEPEFNGAFLGSGLVGKTVAKRVLRTVGGTVTTWATGELYGMWYPDELEPKYEMIRLPHRAPKRIRLLYRKRTHKVGGLYEPIPLRSRLALENQLRALKASETDPGAAAGFEALALRYLREERINQGPDQVGIFQFDATIMPGVTNNVM